MFDWNDVRHLLAVARTGTTAGAGRTLGVSQPTVVRRVAAIEEACGLELFERHATGYALTDAGRALLPLAERLEAAATALADACAARTRKATGIIRLTAPEALMNRFLMPPLARFRARFPGVQVQLISTDERLDIGRGEVDVAIRAGVQGDAGDMAVRPLPRAAWTVYGGHQYLRANGVPADPAALAQHALIGGDGAAADFAAFRWLARVAPDAAIVWRGNTLTGIVAAIQAGLGLAPLPCLIGGINDALQPCFPPPPELSNELWLIVRPELRHDPSMRALTEAIRAHLFAHEAIFNGEATAAAPA